VAPPSELDQTTLSDIRLVPSSGELHEMCGFEMWVDRQTDKLTYRHVDRNTSSIYWGKVKILFTISQSVCRSVALRLVHNNGSNHHW